MAIMFLHGLESGPEGNKTRKLRESFPNIIAPDFQGMFDIEERMAKFEQVTRDNPEPIFLVGSSFGGLASALAFQRWSERFSGYLLLAPALHREEAREVQRVPEQAFVIHGFEDEVVPVGSSREFCQKFGVPLLEVRAGHRLAEVRPLIARVAELLYGNSLPIASSEE